MVKDYKPSEYIKVMSNDGSWYAGSRLLEPLADSLSLPVDQINCMTCFFASILFAIFFRLCLKNVGTIARHLYEATVGVGLLYFFCGKQIGYVFLQSTVSYLVMRFGPASCQHVVVLIYCFAFLSTAHIVRQIYDYGGYTQDVSLPLMIITQRLTSLAFAINDGRKANNDQLPEEHKYLAVKRFPSVLEFYSYIFTFHNPLGVFFHFSDYIAFIEGKNWTRFLQEAKEDNATINRIRNPIVRVQTLEDAEKPSKMPVSEQKLLTSSMAAGFKNVVYTLICLAITIKFFPMFPVSNLSDETWHIENSFLYKCCFMWGLGLFFRLRYFVAFKIVNAANIFIGLAYSGVSADGEPKWELANNGDFWDFEFGSRFALMINAWNKTTVSWLRYLVYSRTKYHPTLATFITSAFWHGFYPGYYMTFLTMALFLQTTRIIRSTIWPLFDQNTATRFIYKIPAFFLVRFALAYLGVPFLLLSFRDSLHFYKMVNYWCHILAILACFGLPRIRRFLSKSSNIPPSSGERNKDKPGKSTTDKKLD